MPICDGSKSLGTRLVLDCVEKELGPVTISEASLLIGTTAPFLGPSLTSVGRCSVVFPMCQPVLLCVVVAGAAKAGLLPHASLDDLDVFTAFSSHELASRALPLEELACEEGTLTYPLLIEQSTLASLLV
uniref:Uncharacterized protein n=1 Tax=Arundo donax TaxID=35708 RepID=A0A0A9EPV2_ARUDO